MVALDLRGYGETDAPSHKENYKLDFLITDIKDILESLGELVEDKLLSSRKKNHKCINIDFKTTASLLDIHIPDM